MHISKNIERGKKNTFYKRIRNVPEKEKKTKNKKYWSHLYNAL